MRRTLLAAAALGAPLLLTLVLIGCGRPVDDEGGGPAAGADGGVKPPVVKAELKPLEGKAGAVLRGKVTLKGSPNIDALAALVKNTIQAKKDDKGTCFDMAPDAEKTQQKWVIDDKTHGVGNVVVWIQPDPDHFFKVDPAGKSWPEKVELAQPHCAFIPHVCWVVPTLAAPDPTDPKKTIPSGQKFFVSNAADVSHNTKWESISGTSNSNELGTIKAHTSAQEVALKGNNSLVHFVCNIHPWMDAYVWVFNHPYAAVTQPDGSYEIKNVPAGAKVHITAWHEQGPNNGFLTPTKIKGDEIELKDGETVKDFDLEYKEQ